MFYSSFERNRLQGENAPESLKNAYDSEIYGGKLTSETVNGPADSWCSPPHCGASGAYCLKVTGKHTNPGRCTAHTVIFDGINETIGKHTYFSYRIFPDFKEQYDYNLTSQYVCVDLKFSDGSFLSEYQIKDINGNILTPQNQGLSGCLYMRQWNEISADISQFEGKTVDEVLVRYDKPSKPQDGIDSEIIVYIDDVKIGKREKKYKAKSDYVLTTRGSNDTLTFSRGLCFPATCVPHPFNFYSPSTTGGGRSIYDYTADKITHFLVSHQASYHLTDYGCLMFMPNTSVAAASEQNCCANARAARFSHDNETANAHYYSVSFDEGSAASGVTAELAPACHSALARFSFPAKSENVNIIFDCVCEYTVDNSSIHFNDDSTFTAESEYVFKPNGMQFEKMYYYGEFSEKPVSTELLSDTRSFACVRFKKGTRAVSLRFASSYISSEQAKKNLELEISKQDTVSAVSARAEKEWNKYLGLFDIKGASEEQLISFYSNIYRMYMYPFTLSENIGTLKKPHYAYLSPYSLREGRKEVKDGMIYTSNGFWDTYRTVWAAYALFTPSHDTELLDGILRHYHDCGWVGRWLYPGAINCMVGTSSDVIFADAAVKGIKFDLEAAFMSAVKNSSVYAQDSTYGRKCNQYASFCGYTPDDICWSMENAVSDSGISEFAKVLGKNDEYEYYKNCALNYQNVFSSEADFFVGKTARGDFMTDTQNFDPYKWGDSYCETNAWGTAFTVQHDVCGMTALYGGKKAFTEKVDGMFSAETKYKASWQQHEMLEARELKMGQYQHSNQPAHHNIFMYNFTSAPYKTQRLTRDVLDRLYIGNKFGQGYMGDDDNGEQSAWYILAAMGFYPMNMGSGQYMITSPLFRELTLHRETGDICITAENQSRENVYIKSMTVDGKPYNNLFITHKELTKAKKIVFEMSGVPSDFGLSGKTPASLSAPGKMLPVMHDVTDGIAFEQTSGLEKNQFNALFDNNKLTQCEFETGCASFDIVLKEPAEVRIFTLSSGENPDKMPRNIRILASESGKPDSFKTVFERDNTVWEFPFMLKPFVLENTGVFGYYRVELSGDVIQPGELELLGRQQA